MSKSLINKSNVRKYALDYAAVNRPANRFTRISEDVYPHVEAAVIQALERLVRSHPSTGRTISAK